MAGEDDVRSGVLSRIAASRIKSVMVELARVPSPLTALFEAEPQLRAFIDAAVEPRLRSWASPISGATPWVVSRRRGAAARAAAR